jgi:ParB family chromosome partitioning protein
LEKVPVNVTEADDAKSLTLAMIENIQRSDLNPMEEAYGYQMLMKREKLTQAKLAEVVSKGRSTIANSLRLLELPEDAQQLLLDGKITAGHARAVLSIPTEEGRALLTQKLSEADITVREAENLARLYAGRKTEAPKRAATPKSFKKVAKGLRDALGTNVRVKTVGGKNKIEIEFKDEAELQELFKKMIG